MPSSSSGNQTGPGSGSAQAGSWWGLLSLAIPLVTAVLLSWHSLGDLDIWFHLRAGRDLLDGQTVTQVNRYSFTEPDHPWVNHEWMFQVLAAATGPGESPDDHLDVRGWNALRVALTILILLGILSGDRVPRRLLGRDGPAWAAWVGIPILAGLLLMWTRLTLRPELFSYLLLVLMIREIERFHRMGPAPADSGLAKWISLVDPRRPGGRIFLITLVWAQFHGFAALAPVLVFLSGILAPLQRRLSPTARETGPGWSRTALMVVLSVMALTLTPNGIQGLAMPVRALTQFQQSQVDLRTTVSELVPLQESPSSLGMTIALYRAGLAAGALWILATLGRIPLLRILVFILAAAGAWANQRSIGFFGIAFILLFTGAPRQAWCFPLPRRWPTTPRLLGAGTGLAILLLTAAFLWPQVIRDDFYLREGVGRRFGAGVNPGRYPVEAARILSDGPDTPLFANLDAAAFMLARTTAPVYIDGRTEAYPATLWAEYLAVRKADDEALEILRARKVESICLATSGGAFDLLGSRLLDSPEWYLRSAEGAGLLFQRHTAGSTVPEARKMLDAAARKTLTHAEQGSPARRADHCLAAGELYLFSGNESEREGAYRRGLRWRPDHPALNHNLGNMLMDRQDFTGALAHFQAALDMNSRLSGSALNAGVCQMRLGAPDEAARYFRRAASISPGKFEAWVNLAVALHRVGNRPAAIGALERALELRPRDLRLRQMLTEWKRGAG